jgi:hypothetical protein
LAFAQGLQQVGWAVGSNLRIDTRWGAGDAQENSIDETENREIAPSHHGLDSLAIPVRAVHH